jgi:hypothetical protein
MFGETIVTISVVKNFKNLFGEPVVTVCVVNRL